MARQGKSKVWDARAWHWISSAICLIGLLLFAITGITLNHAADIEAKPKITNIEAIVPDALLSQLKKSDGNTLPVSFKRWYESQTATHLADYIQVERSEFELYAAMPRAGGDRWFTVALDTGEFYQEATSRGWIAYLNDLHKGRNTGLGWRMFIDVFSVACVVFSLTGLWLLKRYSKGRKSTWPLVASGLLLPLLVLMLPAHASANSQLEIEIPRLSVAEYHPPYVAVWVADEKQKAVFNIAVWYDTKLKNREGEKWLKDLRMWWRYTGRTLEMPVDGISGATRRPGNVIIDLSPFAAQFNALPAGQYSVQVEAARELGGRELISLPLTLPLQDTANVTESGQHELGKIILNMEASK